MAVAMKWLCPLSTSQTGFFLFIRCCSAAEEQPPGARVNTRKGSTQLDSGWPTCVTATAKGDAGVHDLLNGAGCFLAASEVTEKEAPAPARRRPTTADLRRKAASITRGQTPQKVTSRAAVPGQGSTSAAASKGRGGPTATAVALAASEASTPDDLLHFLLVGTTSSAPDLWTAPRAVPIRDLIPSGMRAETYCELLDHLLRPSIANGGDGGSEPLRGESGSMRVVLPAEVVEAAPNICRVELRVLIGKGVTGGGTGDFVMAAVELQRERHEKAPTVSSAAPSKLGNLLHILSAHVKMCNDLRQVADRQTTEIAQLREFIARDTASLKAISAEQILVPLCHILNAKKEKICELTAALQRLQAKPEPTTSAKQATEVKRELVHEEEAASAPFAVPAQRGSHRGQRRRSESPARATAADRIHAAQPSSREDTDDAQSDATVDSQLPPLVSPPDADSVSQRCVARTSNTKSGKRARGEEEGPTRAWIDDLFAP